MRWCAACGKELASEQQGSGEHSFSGYGYLIQFHPECCPIEHDGTICDNRHPPSNPNRRLFVPGQMDSALWLPSGVKLRKHEIADEPETKTFRVKMWVIMCPDCGFFGAPRRYCYNAETGEVFCPACGAPTGQFLEKKDAASR